MLSGVHFEFDPALIIPGYGLQEDIVPMLKASNSARLEFLSYILEKLGLTV